MIILGNLAEQLMSRSRAQACRRRDEGPAEAGPSFNYRLPEKNQPVKVGVASTGAAGAASTAGAAVVAGAAGAAVVAGAAGAAVVAGGL